ncbi:hypothetical protein EYC80_009420 [Monilinia laxa]|uniref:Uncharacterized protein n=1 Tax=Monilinia laxa TaxID=61186 RepID=A0A5N6JXT7_MONLA|nr:hypothetical protein EYC80_009420 [Monilinia laxa]
MPRQNITPKQQREFERLSFNKNRGDDVVFHIFGVHKNEDHKRFEEGEEEDYGPEQQSNAHNTAPTSQRNQSPSTQTYPYVDQPSDGYSQDGSAHDTTVDHQGYQLSLRLPQGSSNPIYRSNMAQSPVNNDYEMSFSTTNFTPGSSMAMGNQIHTANSAPLAFSNSQHNQHAPMQGILNSPPSTRLNPKFVRITMHSPQNDCWNGLTEFRVIENGPFDVVFGRNLLSSPEINHFRDDGIDETPILLEQSDVSPQEQAVIERNRAAADARAKENERRWRPIRPSSGSHRSSEKVKKSSAQKSRH